MAGAAGTAVSFSYGDSIGTIKRARGATAVELEVWQAGRHSHRYQTAYGPAPGAKVRPDELQPGHPPIRPKDCPTSYAAFVRRSSSSLGSNRRGRTMRASRARCKSWSTPRWTNLAGSILPLSGPRHIYAGTSWGQLRKRKKSYANGAVLKLVVFRFPPASPIDWPRTGEAVGSGQPQPYSLACKISASCLGLLCKRFRKRLGFTGLSATR